MNRSRLFRILALTLVVILILAPMGVLALSPNPQLVYESIMALQRKYPDDTPWTNDNYYHWNGASREYPYSGGWGCVAFAYMLSDAAFGSAPAHCIDEPISFSQVRVGDILRLSGNRHSVVVLEIYSDYIKIAEGNYQGVVNWGRRLSKSQVESSYYLLTRYDTLPNTDPTPTPPPPVTMPFTDVKTTDYFYQPVFWAYTNKIVAGTSTTLFSPESPCTRADVVTFLWRAMGSPEPGANARTFADVPSGKYYTKAVSWAAGKGIVAGTPDGYFYPKQQITREDAMTFLWRACGQSTSGISTSPFIDVRDPSHYAYQPILWAYAHGITGGTGDGAFSPKKICTRGQIVCFLFRAYTGGYI